MSQKVQKYSGQVTTFGPHSYFARQVVDAQTASVIFTTTDGPSTGHVGESSFSRGGVKAIGRNEVICAPNGATYVPILDCDADELIEGPAHGVGATAFSGACAVRPDLVILSPENSAWFGYFNPTDRTFVKGPAHGKSGKAYACIAHVGQNDRGEDIVVCAPFSNGGTFDVLNVNTGVLTTGPAATSAIGSITPTPDGKILAVCRANARSPYLFDWRTMTLNESWAANVVAAGGANISLDGKWLITTPTDSSRPFFYDLKTARQVGTTTSIPVPSSGSKSYGAALMSNGDFVMAPQGTDKLWAVRPPNADYPQGLLIEGPSVASGATKFYGAVTDDSGRAVLIPMHSSKFLFVNYLSTGPVIPEPVLSSTYYGRGV